MGNSFGTSLRLQCLIGISMLAACGPSNSGAGGTGDDGGAAKIDSGSDECQASELRCGSSCVNTSVNKMHCGMCNRSCMASESCSNGMCGACAGTSQTAESIVLPADIIVVVDNSGSMTDEAESVQDSMNLFVSEIIASGIDAHVVLISSDSSDDQGICVPAPLGSGACPSDEKLPEFRHVVTTVASSNALSLVLSTYSQWSPSLRPNSSRTIVVISDDDSSLSATDFQSSLIALDSRFGDMRVSAIVAPYELNALVCANCVISGAPCASCDPCCGSDSSLGLLCTPLPADEGAVYKQLVTATGGVLGNLCQQDFGPAFSDLAMAVIGNTSVGCGYGIPTPTNGDTINFDEVNVNYQLTMAGTEVGLAKVADAASCGVNGGWYYSPPAMPTEVVLCPVSCDLVQASDEASVSVNFGCSTIVE